MKKWILKQFIARSEITGKPVPGWMHHWVDENEFARLREDEAELTSALREGSPDNVPLPEELRERLDRKIRANEPVVVPSRQSLFPVWIAAAAAVAVIGLYSIFFFPEAGVLTESDSPTVAVAESSESHQPEKKASVDAFENTPSFSGDILVKPLKEERARLAADMSNAIQFVASSLLPDSYAEQLNSNIETIEKEIAGSI